jgi:hypothetical protein
MDLTAEGQSNTEQASFCKMHHGIQTDFNMWDLMSFTRIIVMIMIINQFIY